MILRYQFGATGYELNIPTRTSSSFVLKFQRDVAELTSLENGRADYKIIVCFFLNLSSSITN